MNVFLLKNSDPFWKTLDYLQSNVKAQVGLGTPIVIKFYPDLSSKHPDHADRLHYDYTQFGEDHKIENEFIYCLKQWYKIWEYLQRVHLFEVLTMRAQFTKDDDGKIFFVYVKDLNVRKIPPDFEHQIILEEVQNINQEAKERLVNEINSHLDNTKSHKKIHSIYETMNNHYSGIKNGIGVTELYGKDYLETEQDKIAEDAFKTLRPESPYKLNELINQKNFKEK